MRDNGHRIFSGVLAAVLAAVVVAVLNGYIDFAKQLSGLQSLIEGIAGHVDRIDERLRYVERHGRGFEEDRNPHGG